MKATTRRFAVLLTCVACASTVAAQAPQDTYTRVFELRQESNCNSNKAQTQNEARQRANAGKAEAARQRRGGRRAVASVGASLKRPKHLRASCIWSWRHVRPQERRRAT